MSQFQMEILARTGIYADENKYRCYFCLHEFYEFDIRKYDVLASHLRSSKRCPLFNGHGTSNIPINAASGKRLQQIRSHVQKTERPKSSEL